MGATAFQLAAAIRVAVGRPLHMSAAGEIRELIAQSTTPDELRAELGISRRRLRVVTPNTGGGAEAGKAPPTTPRPRAKNRQECFA